MAAVEPVLARIITVGDRDSEGNVIKAGSLYILEWLLPATLILNPGFETHVGDDFSQWTEQWDPGFGDVTAELADMHSGLVSCRIKADPGHLSRVLTPIGQEIVIDAHHRWNMGAWVKRIAMPGAAPEMTWSVYFYDSGTVFLDQVDRGFKGSDLTGAWAYYQFGIEADNIPIGAKFARIFIETTELEVLVDDVYFYRGSPVLDPYTAAVLLRSNSEETYTFPKFPTVGESEKYDDPVIRHEFEDGSMTEYVTREPRTTLAMGFLRMTTGQVKQLGRFYQKVRGFDFTYTDPWNTEYQVRMPGPLRLQHVTRDLWDVGVTLEIELP